MAIEWGWLPACNLIEYKPPYMSRASGLESQPVRHMMMTTAIMSDQDSIRSFFDILLVSVPIGTDMHFIRLRWYRWSIYRDWSHLKLHYILFCTSTSLKNDTNPFNPETDKFSYLISTRTYLIFLKYFSGLRFSSITPHLHNFLEFCLWCIIGRYIRNNYEFNKIALNTFTLELLTS